MLVFGQRSIKSERYSFVEAFILFFLHILRLRSLLEKLAKKLLLISKIELRFV